MQSSDFAGTVCKRSVAQPSVREIKSGTPIPVALVASTDYSQTEITSEPVEPILDPRIRSGWLAVGHSRFETDRSTSSVTFRIGHALETP